MIWIRNIFEVAKSYADIEKSNIVCAFLVYIQKLRMDTVKLLDHSLHGMGLFPKFNRAFIYQ